MNLQILMAILNKVGDKFPQVWPLVIQEVNTLQEIISKLHGQAQFRMDTSKVSTADGSRAVSILTTSYKVPQDEATRVVATLEACHGHLSA